MENKTKFIIIGLIAVSAVFIFLYMQTLNSKQALLRDREKLMADNASLAQQAEDSQRKAKQLEGQLSSLNSVLDRLNGEKDELEKRLDLLTQEKEDLVERLKTAQQMPAAAAGQEQQQPQPQVPVTEDTYWAGVLKVKTDLEFQLGTLRNELRSVQINNEELQRQKAALELDIKSLQRDKQDLKRQLDYNQKLMDSIAQEVVREKNDKAQIQESLQAIKNENIVLRRQLHSLDNRRVNLEKKLQEFQETRSALERRLNEMETMLSGKITQISNLKERLQKTSGALKPQAPVPEEGEESVDLPPIVVRPQAQGAAPEESTTVTQVQAGEGKILAMNRENNFVIIDLGEAAGIKVGNTFQVYRGNDSIATIEVIQVRKDIAACDIKQQVVSIKIGDTVR